MQLNELAQARVGTGLARMVILTLLFNRFLSYSQSKCGPASQITFLDKVHVGRMVPVYTYVKNYRFSFCLAIYL